MLRARVATPATDRSHGLGFCPRGRVHHPRCRRQQDGEAHQCRREEGAPPHHPTRDGWTPRRRHPKIVAARNEAGGRARDRPRRGALGASIGVQTRSIDFRPGRDRDGRVRAVAVARSSTVGTRFSSLAPSIGHPGGGFPPPRRRPRSKRPASHPSPGSIRRLSPRAPRFAPASVTSRCVLPPARRRERHRAFAPPTLCHLATVPRLRDENMRAFLRRRRAAPPRRRAADRARRRPRRERLGVPHQPVARSHASPGGSAASASPRPPPPRRSRGGGFLSRADLEISRMRSGRRRKVFCSRKRRCASPRLPSPLARSDPSLAPRPPNLTDL